MQKEHNFKNTLHQCKIAFEEIVTENVMELSRQDVINWKKKYKCLFHNVEKTPLQTRYPKFCDLYLTFAFILDMTSNFDRVKLALESFEQTPSIIEWLQKNDRLFFCETQAFECFFNTPESREQIIQHQYYRQLYFKGEEFRSIIDFNRLFKKHYELCATNFDRDVPF